MAKADAATIWKSSYKEAGAHFRLKSAKMLPTVTTVFEKVHCKTAVDPAITAADVTTSLADAVARAGMPVSCAPKLTPP
jgi:hypothetical protein